MTDNGGLEARVAALETEMAAMATAPIDAADARRNADHALLLATCADRDVADVRLALSAHNKVLQALRQTQLEQGEQMKAGFAKFDAEFAAVHAELAEIRGGFATMKTGMEHIVTLLEGLTSSES
jgi:hypothetical protein